MQLLPLNPRQGSFPPLNSGQEDSPLSTLGEAASHRHLQTRRFQSRTSNKKIPTYQLQTRRFPPLNSRQEDSPLSTPDRKITPLATPNKKIPTYQLQRRLFLPNILYLPMIFQHKRLPLLNL